MPHSMEGYVDDDEEFYDDEAELSLAERELAEDAQWKVIQKNTFTRWVNQHLKPSGLMMNDLQYDMSDGLMLVALIENLSRHHFKHKNRKPNFRTQKLENITMVLRFLEENEGLKLVNIDSTDIADNKIKLILGLIWTLILHYSITLPTNDGDQDPASRDKSRTPKQRLLDWVNSKIPHRPVKNFTTDWNDGTAIGALVDALSPGLCPDWPAWDRGKPLRNAREAIEAAEHGLGVAPLIHPEEMVNPRTDEKAMMTYLSQFINARPTGGAPYTRADPGMVRAFGPGLELHGNRVNKVAPFTVDATGAGRGYPDIIVLNPRGQRLPVTVRQVPGVDSTWDCSYLPVLEGEHRVIIKYSGGEIPGSPFRVKVEGVPPDPSRVTAAGPGIEPTGNWVDRRTFFNVFTAGAGAGTVNCIILDPRQNAEAIKPRITQQSADNYLVEYVPRLQGMHSVNIFFNDQPIPCSPYGVMVEAAPAAMQPQDEFFGQDEPLTNGPRPLNQHPLMQSGPYAQKKPAQSTSPQVPADQASLVYATGRGIELHGNKINRVTHFKIHTEKASVQVEPGVVITAPDGKTVPHNMRKFNQHTYEVNYIPAQAGTFIVKVTYGTHPIDKSPFDVEVEPLSNSKVRAFGPGLRSGRVNKPAVFTIDPNGETGPISCTIEGPDGSSPNVEVKDDEPKSESAPKPTTKTATYVPTQPGEHTLHVKHNDQDIADSPFSPVIKPEASSPPSIDPTKFKAFGPGVEPDGGVKQNHPTHFTVAPREDLDKPITGALPLQVEVQNLDNGKPVPVAINDKGDGTADCTYTPRQPGKLSVSVAIDDEPIEDSPFFIEADADTDNSAAPDLGLVKVYGPGIVSATEREPTKFTVDATQVGQGTINVGIKNEQQQPVPHQAVLLPTAAPKTSATDEQQPIGPKMEVSYTPMTPGPHYTVDVAFEEAAAAASPYKVPIKPAPAAATEQPAWSPANAALMQQQQPRKQKPQFPAYGGGDQPQQAARSVPSQGGKGVARVQNLLPSVQTGVPQEFQLIMERFPGPAKPRPEIRIRGARNMPINPRVEEKPFGFTIGYTPEFPGEHLIAVNVDGYGPVEGSPFRVEAVSQVDHEDSGLSPSKRPLTQSAPPKQKPLFQQPKQPQYGNMSQGPPASARPVPKVSSMPAPGGKRPKSYMEDAPVDQSERPQESKWPQCRPGSNASRVHAHGDGLYRARVNEQADFVIDSREAPPAPISVTLEGPAEARIDFQDRGDGTCQVGYVAPEPGLYTLNVLYEESHIPGSPFHPVVQTAAMEARNMDRGKIRVYGQGLQPNGVYKESFARFTVDARAVDPRGDGIVKVTINSPSGQRTAGKVINNGNGIYSCQYSPLEEGPYKVEVSHDGFPVRGSAFPVNVRAGSDPSRVTAYGPGLEYGQTNQPAQFIVDLDGAGQGGLGLAIEGPGDTQIDCHDNKDGTCTVVYIPPRAGTYDVYVKFNETNVPGSPFHVPITDQVDSARVRCHGPGLQPRGVVQNQPTSFIVDASAAGEAPINVNMILPNGRSQPIHQVMPKPGTARTFDVAYTPRDQGPCQVEVLYANQPVPGSPFPVQVGPSRKPVSQSSMSPQPQPIRPQFKQPVQSFVAAPPVAKPHPPPLNVGKVHVTGEGVKPARGSLPASLPAVFQVDTREAGPQAHLSLNLMNPRNQPTALNIDNHGNGTYTCSYLPHEPGQYVVQASYGGQVLPESPFRVNVVPTGRGDACRIEDEIPKVIPINQESVITVDTSQATGPGQISCTIDSEPTSGGAAAGRRPQSGKQSVPVFVEENGDQTVSISYLPTVPGDYTGEIRFGGQVIPGGKFVQKAVPANQLPRKQEPVVPRRAASPVEMTPQKYVPVSVSSRGQAPTYPGHNPRTLATYDSVDFRLPVGPNFNLLYAVIHTPSGQMHQPNIIDNHDGTVTIQYQPSEKGTHAMEVTYNNHPILGSPFHFEVQTVRGGGVVTAYGPGLSHGRVNEPACFTIVTKNVGQGGLSLTVEGPSKAEITCDDNRDGTCSASFLPTLPGQYTVVIKFQDRHIPGSPFKCNIAGDKTNQFSHLTIGTTSEVPLIITEHDISTLSASVLGPSKQEEPCILKRMPNGHLGISFTPREPGEHLVNVFRFGQHIANSPFSIIVSPKEIGNASRVRCYGPGIDQGGMANQPAHFTVDTRDAGYGSLSLSIEGPSKAEIDCKDNHDGTCLVTYRPTEPGTYIINVSYGNRVVPGSPFAVEIGGVGSGLRITERITRERDAVDVTHVGSQCEMSLRIPNTNPVDMSAVVAGPSGYTEICDIHPTGECSYIIQFVPRETGVHTVSVKHRGIHIPGSPFQFTVGKIAEGGSQKVRASGPGLSYGSVDCPNEFSVYTREGGAGTLSIAIEGPSKADIEFEDRKDGSCGVVYHVSQPGDYLCSIKFNDQHIPESPFRLYVGGGDASYQPTQRVMRLQQTQQYSQLPPPRRYTSSTSNTTNYNIASRDSTSAFRLGHSGALTLHCGTTVPNAANLRAVVASPSGLEFDALVEQVGADQFSVRFVPEESGVHLIHVTTRDNGRPINGSPFQVVVTPTYAPFLTTTMVQSDPGMVTVSGDGLYRGDVNVTNKFFVNTENAGSGALSVTIDGPSKVQLDCQEQGDGYMFTYVATAPGEYIIAIKYAGNNHINGSPFKCYISGGEDSSLQRRSVARQQSAPRSRLSSTVPAMAELVRCEGSALTRAYIGKDNQFVVDASQGGSDVLLVGLTGPNGPIDEVNIRHVGGQQFHVCYLVRDSGTHMLFVKWGDKHVPGSPFVLEVP